MRRALSLAAAAIALSIAAVSPAGATNVTVHINNVATDKGVVRIFVCSEKQFLTEQCDFKQVEPAQSGKMEFVVKGVEPGAYSVAAYHDANTNGKMDRGFLGIMPLEGYGFSRLGRLYSKPRFSNSSVEVEGDATAVDVNLYYP
jgi:uncharacterized protein (DUF2141 family)